MNPVVHFAPTEALGAIYVALAGAEVARGHFSFVFFLVWVPTLRVQAFRVMLFNLRVERYWLIGSCNHMGVQSRVYAVVDLDDIANHTIK